MDETIKEIYDSGVKSQEREIDLIKNRLEFINWLFGVASALLFASVLVARAITPDLSPVIAPENCIVLATGIFSFLAIVCTFLGKWQGYNSVVNRITILTLLDIQKSVFLKKAPPNGSTDEKAVKFAMFEYLPNEHKEEYDHCSNYGERKYSEIFWLISLIVCVFISLALMLLLLAELTI